MTAAPFAYQAPTRLEDALDALSSASTAGRAAAIIAGGQSLVPLMLRRQSRPDLLIDINRLPDLADIRLTAQGIAMGALVRLEQARHHPVVRRMLPLLADALSWVANPTVRARGTVIGNLVQNAPGAELPAVAIALGARLILARGAVREEVEAARIVARLHPLPPDTIVTHVLWPVAEAESDTPPRGGFWEIAGRDGHKALVGAAVALQGGADCSVALCGLGDTAFRARTVASAIAAALPTAPATAAIDAALVCDLNHAPSFVVRGDILADAAYRRDVAPVVIQRATQRALAQYADA